MLKHLLGAYRPLGRVNTGFEHLETPAHEDLQINGLAIESNDSI